MPASKFNAEKLIQKYKAGKTSPEEYRLLMQWYDELPEKALDRSPVAIAEDLDEIWERLEIDIEHVPAKKSYTIFYRLAAVIAAALLIFGGVLLVDNKQKSHTPLVLAQRAIKPGTNVATLSFSNGQRISLDELPNGKTIHEGGANIMKTASGKIVYLLAPSSVPAVLMSHHTITTPKGGQYQVTLPDGSTAWLNAASSITYPSAFNDYERLVSMSGEVYFEVAENKAKPFKVNTGKMQVQVLGTHFNVSAYQEDPSVSTTLFQGAVTVGVGARKVNIVPGQVADWNRNQSIKTGAADLEAALAWKNGYFIFHNEHIKSIMSKLSRWYDVPVTYHGNTSGLNFSAKIPRKSNIYDILKILESTGTIHFKIEERRIVVSQK